MSNMLRRLEQDQIIYREHDDADSRVSKVYLTHKGKKLQKPIELIWKQHEEQMSDNLSDTPDT